MEDSGMRRRTFLAHGSLAGVGFLVSPWALSGCREQRRLQPAPESRPGASFAPRYLVLEGSPRERGRIHGESLRAEIQEMVAGLLEMASSGGADPTDGIARIVRGTGFLDAAERWVPHVVEEIRGIGDGAGIAFETVFAWNLLDEAEWFFMRDRWESSEYRDEARCSAFAVAGDSSHPTIVAQNADMGPSYDGLQTVLHVKHDDTDLEEILLTVPGATGIWGMSNRSMGICLNALTTKLNPSTQGLATTFIARGILYQRTLDDAIGFVTGVDHASGQVYTFGAPQGVACFEGSANRVARFLPSPGATRVYHTNHPLVSDDIWLSVDNPERIAPEIRDRFAIGIENSRTRLRSLEKRLRDESVPITVDSAKSILCSHDSEEYPLCRHDESGNITTFSMVMELGDSPVMHMAPGPGCTRLYRTYGF
jgi:isopenicillin-N N-acyltransferase-like protein